MDKLIASLFTLATFSAFCSCRIQNFGALNQGFFRSAARKTSCNEIGKTAENAIRACNCPEPTATDGCQLIIDPAQQQPTGCKPNADEACRSAISSFAEAVQNASDANEPYCPVSQEHLANAQALNANCNNNPSTVGPGPSCGGNQFSCGDGSCIPNSYKCDDYYDCADGSDERGCGTTPGPSCGGNQFSCGDGSCIPNSYKCDNDQDCADGSDELDCGTPPGPSCGGNQFTCGNGSCIPNSYKCDNYQDCADGSDERDCSFKP